MTSDSRSELETALQHILSGFDERDLAILAGRTFRLRGRLGLQELGDRFGITRERVRQLEAKHVELLRKRLCRSAFKPLTAAADRVRNAIGLAVPVAFAESAHLLPQVATDDAPSSAVVDLPPFLLWVTDEYEIAKQWLIRKPAQDVIRNTQHCVTQALRNGSACPSDVSAGLRDLGLRLDFVPPWVTQFCKLRTLDGVMVRWAGSLADKAAAVLELKGQPLSRDEIAALIGDDRSIRTLANYLFSDPRFRRVGPDRFGLSTWEGSEYISIAEEIQRVLDANGGEAPGAIIVGTVLGRVSVSENSVRTYLNGPRFCRTSRGTYRTRHSADSASPGRPAGLTARCYRLADGWCYKLDVNAEHLRGSGLPLPSSLAVALDVKPLACCYFDSHYGPIRLSWVSPQPTIGSLRLALEDLCGQQGDVLFVSFRDQRQVTFDLCPRARLEAAAGEQRLLLEVGWLDHSLPPQPLHLVAERLGVDGSSSVNDAIRVRLRARGEDTLLDLIPAARLTEDTDALEDLLSLFSIPTSRQTESHVAVPVEG